MKNTKLYKELRKNGREKLTNLSRTLHMPVSSIFERIRRASALKRFTVLLDYQELGYPCLTHTIIKVEKSRKDDLRGFLKNHPNTNGLFRINNGYDFIVEGVFESMQEAEKFIESLDEFDVIEEKTHYVLEEIEREGFLAK